MDTLIQKLFRYVNPIAHLGERKYSYKFPFIFSLLTAVFIEVYAYLFHISLSTVGLLAIFFFIALIIYFAFRDGVRGGFITTGITICYYVYIMYSRHYTGQQLENGIRTTIILGLLYLLLAGAIGWLKQKIDGLIEQEADEQKRLQTIMQQLPVGVIVTDHKGKVIQANKQIEKILGVTVLVGYEIGKDKAFVTSKQKESAHSSVLQALASRKSLVGKEFVMRRSGGKKTYLQVNTSLIQNKIGKVIAAASIVHDITEQKETEKRKDDFVNMASHELKTPITSMKLYIDSLMKRLHIFQDQRSVNILSKVKNQTERLQELVNDLLDVSRLQTGKLNYKQEEFRLDKLVLEIIDDLQGSAKQHISLTKQLPLTVYADKFRIYQVLTNLVSNAIKYSKGTENIYISLKRADKKAVISVQDFGLGIAKSQQKKIFDRLYQVVDAKEKTFPGLGMGLYIAKEIIKRHKGSIWVESEKGKGSTFFFSLALHKKNYPL